MYIYIYVCMYIYNLPVGCIRHTRVCCLVQISRFISLKISARRFADCNQTKEELTNSNHVTQVIHQKDLSSAIGCLRGHDLSRSVLLPTHWMTLCVERPPLLQPVKKTGGND